MSSLGSRVLTACGGQFSDEQRTGLSILQRVLPSTVALSTFSKYKPEWQKYEIACGAAGLSPLTACEVQVALYLAKIFGECAEADVGSSRLRAVSAAIAYYLTLSGKKSPTALPLCSGMCKGASRLLVATRTAREPLLPEQLKRALEFHLGSGCALSTRMHLTVLLLMFVGLLRYSDVAQLIVHEDLLRIVHAPDGRVEGALMFVQRSKTDQACIGHWVAIGATGGPLCPVALLQKLLQQGRYVRRPGEGQDCGPLLRAVYRGSDGVLRLKQYTAPLCNLIKPLGYSTFMGHLRALLQDAGVEGHFGTHSARIGGTTAASMAGADEKLVRTHGRWRHGNTADDVYAREVQANAQRFFVLTREFWPF
jgi:hypothetical protein